MKKISIFCLSLLLLPLLTFATSPKPAFVAGKQYQIIPKKDQTKGTTQDGKIKVIEFFSYGCPYCFKFEPVLEHWLKHKPADVDFTRVPAVFESGWLTLAKAYYTAQALGISKKITPVIFDDIHVKGKDLSSEKALKGVFAKQGITDADFESAFKFSPGIDASLLRGRKLMAKYKVFQIPTVVIAGRYKTDPKLAGNFKNMPKIINFLIKKAKDDIAKH